MRVCVYVFGICMYKGIPAMAWMQRKPVSVHVNPKSHENFDEDLDSKIGCTDTNYVLCIPVIHCSRSSEVLAVIRVSRDSSYTFDHSKHELEVNLMTIFADSISGHLVRIRRENTYIHMYIHNHIHCL